MLLGHGGNIEVRGDIICIMRLRNSCLPSTIFLQFISFLILGDYQAAAEPRREHGGEERGRETARPENTAFYPPGTGSL